MPTQEERNQNQRAVFMIGGFIAAIGTAAIFSSHSKGVETTCDGVEWLVLSLFFIGLLFLMRKQQQDRTQTTDNSQQK